MATMFTSSSQTEEENKPKRRRKPPSKVRQRKESKLCYMHLISVHKKKEKVQGFTRKRWETYRTCVGRWLGLQGVSKDVAEAHKHCVEVDFERLPQDAGFHLTCYRRFTDIQRLAAAEKRLARTLEDPDAAGQSVPSSDCIGAKAATSETPRKKRRSRTRCFPVASAAAGPVPPGSCIICQKVDKHVTVGGKRQRDQLSQAKTLSAGQVLKAAEMREDSTVFDNVCVALEVRYHRSCYQQYTRILSRSMETTDEGEQDKLKRRRTRELAQLVLPCPTKSNISELVCVETLSADKLLDRLPQPSGTETTTESTEMSISVGCVSSHGMSPQCHIFTLEDNRTEAGYLSLLPVCKEEVSPEQQDRSPSLVQEEPEPPQIKEEQEEELLQRPEEAAGSTLTLLAVKSEADEENRDTEPIASTSTEHMKTQADVENCGASQPTSDQLLSSHCSESDTEDSDDWEETREGQSALNKLNSELFQDLKSSKQNPPMRTHTGKKSWRCTECGKVLGYMSHLKAHMITHTGEKPFACTDCDKVFGYMSDLKRHVRTHTGEKPFICTECGKVFRSMGNLKVHMNTHTGEKPFACTECVKMFNKKSDLKQHMNSHTGEKPFSCTVCSKAFSSLYTLNTHMRIHAGEKRFTCTKCGKVCVQISHLKYHMRTHTGEKPFTCTECGKAFSSMSNLKQHMITHTGEKPFTCIVCGERFSQNGTLKRHMNKLHP